MGEGEEEWGEEERERQVVQRLEGDDLQARRVSDERGGVREGEDEG